MTSLLLTVQQYSIMSFFVVVLIDVLPFTMKVFIHKLNTFKLNDNLIDLYEWKLLISNFNRNNYRL